MNRTLNRRLAKIESNVNCHPYSHLTDAELEVCIAKNMRVVLSHGNDADFDEVIQLAQIRRQFGPEKDKAIDQMWAWIASVLTDDGEPVMPTP